MRRRAFMGLASAVAMGAGSREVRKFVGEVMILVPSGQEFYDIELTGAVRRETGWTYEFRGRKAPFTWVSAEEMNDQEVIDHLMSLLVARARRHPGILGKMAKAGGNGRQWPLWLMRTSVRHYRVKRRGPFRLIDHSDRDIDRLLEHGAVGPIV